MKRNAYTIDHLNATVTVTKSFLKEAGIIGSPVFWANILKCILAEDADG